ncbi:MAG: glycosyltransferase [Actinobacteria bacterium]|nr:glycosyltransferase [Actinomycetota bacterium]
MKIALFHLTINIKSGKEAVIFELAKRSRHNWTIFTSYYNKNTTFSNTENIKIVELKDEWVLNQKNIIAKSCLNLPFKKLPMDDFDVLFIVTGGIDHLVAYSNKSKPLVSVCLTPLRTIYDNKFRKVYTKNQPSKKLKIFLQTPFFKFIDHFAWNSFEHIFCISHEVQSRLLKAKLVDKNKTEIIYPGIDINEFKPNWNYNKTFLLPGRIMWTKNIELGIEVFKNFQQQPPQFEDFELVIAGMVDKDSRSYLNFLKETSRDNKKIKFIESPSDEQFKDLFKNCYGVIFTAINEDFGIVPIEAMAFGKPIICLNEGGPRETVIHNQTGFLVNNKTEFVEALIDLAGNNTKNQELGKNAREASLKYDWKYFVQKIDDYLDSLET